MPSKMKLIAAVCAAATMGSMAFAGTPTGKTGTDTCPTTESEAQQLQCWQDEYQLENAELQALLAKKKVADETGQSDMTDNSRQLSIPNVQLIYGASEKSMSAVLVYSNDRSLTVHPGEQVPGGFTVQSINSNPPSVVLSHDGTPLVLLMGGNGSSLQSSSNANEPTDNSGVVQPGSIVEPPGGIPGPAGMAGN